VTNVPAVTQLVSERHKMAGIAAIPRHASRRARRLLQLALMVTDAVLMSGAVGAAGLLRLQLDGVAPVVPLGHVERHVLASFLIVPALLGLFWLRGLYDLDRILVGTREYAQIVHGVSYGVLLTLTSSFFVGGPPLVSRSWLLLLWGLVIGSVFLGRFVARRVVRHLRRAGRLHTRVVVVGASQAGIQIAEQLRQARNEGIDVIGFLDEYVPLGQELLPGVAVTGRPGDLVRSATERGGTERDEVDEYILVSEALPHERLAQISRLMVTRSRPALRLVVSSVDLLTHGLQVDERGYVPFVTLRRARLGAVETALKYGFDVLVTAFTLAVLMPSCVFVLGRWYFERRGPLMCRYPIYGVGGAKVMLWLLHPNVTTWLPLRGVPALLAVIGGQLSLVGPRPVVWRENSADPPEIWLTAAKPGLTGPWRLLGPSASTTDQATQDLTYVRNYSIWEDVRILWSSIRNLHLGRLSSPLARWQEHSEPFSRRAIAEGAAI
jgi:lipopolysaccharide/colanic/teichoic acid biosynthesis glycosyltransferase